MGMNFLDRELTVDPDLDLPELKVGAYFEDMSKSPYGGKIYRVTRVWDGMFRGKTEDGQTITFMQKHWRRLKYLELYRAGVVD